MSWKNVDGCAPKPTEFVKTSVPKALSDWLLKNCDVLIWTKAPKDFARERAAPALNRAAIVIFRKVKAADDADALPRLIS